MLKGSSGTKAREEERERGQRGEKTSGGWEKGAEGTREEGTRGPEKIQSEWTSQVESIRLSHLSHQNQVICHVHIWIHVHAWLCVSWLVPWRSFRKERHPQIVEAARLTLVWSRETPWTSFESRETPRVNGWEEHRMDPVGSRSTPQFSHFLVTFHSNSLLRG